MSSDQPTQRLIAQRMGLSTAAVSRALRRPRDSDSTAKAVHEAAEAIGYRPLRSYKSPRSRQPCVIGVLAIGDGMLNPELLSSLSHAAAHANSQLLASTASSQPSEQIRAVELLLSRRTDGLILLGGNRISSDAVAWARAVRTPVLTIDAHFDGCGSVTLDRAAIQKCALDFITRQAPSRTWFVASQQGADSPKGTVSELVSETRRLGHHPYVIDQLVPDARSPASVEHPSVPEMVIAVGTEHAATAHMALLARRRTHAVDALLVNENAADAHGPTAYGAFSTGGADPAITGNLATQGLVAMLNGEEPTGAVSTPVLRQSLESGLTRNLEEEATGRRD